MCRAFRTATLAVGGRRILSQPIVILPYLVFQTGMVRTVQHREPWDESSRKKALMILRIRYRMTWLMALMHVGVCLLFLTSFMANVSDKTVGDFFRAACSRLVRNYSRTHSSWHSG